MAIKRKKKVSKKKPKKPAKKPTRKEAHLPIRKKKGPTLKEVRAEFEQQLDREEEDAFRAIMKAIKAAEENPELEMRGLAEDESDD